MSLLRADSDSFLSDSEGKLLTPSGSSSSASVSAAELVKTKKCGREEKLSKKPQLQQGDHQETHAFQSEPALIPIDAATLETASIGFELPIVCPLQPYPDSGEIRCPQTAAVSSECEERSNTQASNLHSHLSPDDSFL